MPPSADQAIFERLTSRHVDVLVVLAADVRRRQRIAARLGIGVSTISSHLHALYELTSIHDADDLAAWWKEHRVAYALFALDRLGVTPAEILEHLTSEPRQ